MEITEAASAARATMFKGISQGVKHQDVRQRKWEC